MRRSRSATPAEAVKAPRRAPRSRGRSRRSSAAAAAAAHRLRPIPAARASGILAQLDDDQRAAADDRGRPAADRRRARARAKPARSPIASPIWSPSAASPPEQLPRHHLHPPRRCRDARAAARPARRSSTDKIAIHTFHSLGLAILREHWSAAGLQSGLSRRGRGRAHRAARRDARTHARTRRSGCCARSPRAKRTAELRPSAEADGGAGGLSRARWRGARLDRLRRSRRASRSACSGGSRTSPSFIAAAGHGSRSTNSRMSTRSNTGC